MPEEHGNGTAGALTGLGAVPSPHRGLPIPPRSPLLSLWHPRSKLVAGHSFSWRSERLLCLQSRHENPFLLPTRAARVALLLCRAISRIICQRMY